MNFFKYVKPLFNKSSTTEIFFAAILSFTVIAFNFDQMTSEMAKINKEEEEEARKTK